MCAVRMQQIRWPGTGLPRAQKSATSLGWTAASVLEKDTVINGPEGKKYAGRSKPSTPIYPVGETSIATVPTGKNIITVSSDEFKRLIRGQDSNP